MCTHCTEGVNFVLPCLVCKQGNGEDANGRGKGNIPMENESITGYDAVVKQVRGGERERGRER